MCVALYVLQNRGGAKGEMCVLSTGVHKRAGAGHTNTWKLLPALEGDKFCTGTSLAPGKEGRQQVKIISMTST